jgi:hypothetical protein
MQLDYGALPLSPIKTACKHIQQAWPQVSLLLFQAELLFDTKLILIHQLPRSETFEIQIPSIDQYKFAPLVSTPIKVMEAQSLSQRQQRQLPNEQDG